MKNSTKQAVYGIVFNKERTEVLLVKRRDIPVWVLPGGGLDPEELPDAGAKREVEEETGYTVETVRKVAEYLPINRLSQLTHVYECRIVKGSATTGEEASAIAFFPIGQLPGLLPPFFKGWIGDALANHPHLIRKEIEGVSYWVVLKFLFLHPILVIRFLLSRLGVHLNH